MNICVPVESENGLKSLVCAHFGSAPLFVVVDTDTGACRAIVNGDQHHAHGMCTPLGSLQRERIDGIVVGGIGMGALNKLNAANISVYAARHATVGEVVTAFKAGSLKLMHPGMACAHHGHGHP
jgi:predicted Fe-Mo cluster-binding NifX family protein